MDDFAIAPPRQIETAREHIAQAAVTVPRVAGSVRRTGIVAVAAVGRLTCLVTIIMTVAVVVLFLDSWGTRAASKRQRIILVFTITVVLVA